VPAEHLQPTSLWVVGDDDPEGGLEDALDLDPLERLAALAGQ
jgi:hypothetical protein